jgi:membrane-bound lytic murein transglycosylase MltF
LEKEILDYYHTDVKKLGAFSNRWSQYMKRIKQIRNNGQGEEAKRFEQTMAIFEKYSQQYNFDPLMLIAQGFQESRLDQKARSHVGAVGVMQVMPTTGAELKVGDIFKLEPNIHAGSKYLDKLMSKYFVDANFSGNNRALFAFASYNAGPGNVAKMRKLARERGLDPDTWFNNVELVMAEKIGMEPTTYVRNIFKYYVAYKMLVAQKEEMRRAREKLEAGAGK